MSEVYHSRVYTDRPEYADFDAPKKFQAIQGIVARRMEQEHQVSGQMNLFEEAGA